MRAAVHQIVTFATTPFEGNPAFVLAVQEPVEEAVLVRICEQLQAGVLAVLGRATAGRRSLAFYTASGPHGGAGHSAHAAAHVSLPDDGEMTFELPGGDILEASRRGGMVSVRWKAMPAARVPEVADLAAALGRLPLSATVAPFGYVAVFDAAADLAALRPDLARIRLLDRGAVIATAPGTEADFALRVFAPNLGLNEDPVCGTAHRILAPYWAAILGKGVLQSRQMSPRGGDLWCAVEPGFVTISGASHPFLSGMVEVP